MSLTIYIVIALLGAISCIIAGYGINNATATSLSTQQSSIVSEQYSSDDGQRDNPAVIVRPITVKFEEQLACD